MSLRKKDKKKSTKEDEKAKTTHDNPALLATQPVSATRSWKKKLDENELSKSVFILSVSSFLIYLRNEYEN
jgi:hypothetical protein